MSSDTLDIYDAQLSEQLGSDGVFTENAVYDPTGSALPLAGVFDDNTKKDNKDGANVYQKNEFKRFIVSEILDFDIYLKKQITLTKRAKTYTIDYIDKDLQGVQVLWLV